MPTDYEIMRAEVNAKRAADNAVLRRNPKYVAAERAKWNAIHDARKDDPVFKARQRAYQNAKHRKLKTGATRAEANRAGSIAGARIAAKMRREQGSNGQ